MMNALAIALIATSLASAGVWSPPTPEENQDDVIVKEGHRVVVVKYDQDGNPNTKVSISPDHDLLRHETAENAADHAEESGYHGPKELICDAFGKCRHKIASAFGRAKEEAEEAVEEKIGKVKDEARDSVRNKMDSAKDTAKDEVRSVKEGISESAGSARERVRETAMSRAKKMKDFGERHLGLEALSVLLNLMGFVTAYGMSVWVTFVSSYVLASAMPRHQFGLVQSKLYPVYFQAMLYSIAITLLGHLLSRRKLLMTSRPDILQAYNLVATILMVLVNMDYLEPRATKVMMEKLKVEKEEVRGRDLGAETRQGIVIPQTEVVPPATAMQGDDTPRRRLNDRLRKLNSYSSFLNVMSLMALTWHLVYLSQRLAMTC